MNPTTKQAGEPFPCGVRGVSLGLGDIIWAGRGCLRETRLNLANLHIERRQTLQGSFSAASKEMFATKYTQRKGLAEIYTIHSIPHLSNIISSFERLPELRLHLPDVCEVFCRHSGASRSSDRRSVTRVWQTLN